VAKLPGKLTKRGLISGGGRRFSLSLSLSLSKEFSELTGCTHAPMQSVLEPFPFGSKAALRKPGPSTPPGTRLKLTEQNHYPHICIDSLQN